MAPASRRPTGKAAPSKGAASAVSAETTAHADDAITVDAANPTDERERLRALAAQDTSASGVRDERAATAAAQQLGVPTTAGIPAAAGAAELAEVDTEATPKITEGVHGQVGAVEEPIVRSTEPPAPDLATLRRLADTSGDDPVTPYPEGSHVAPNPVQLLPEVRDTARWGREGDDTNMLTARVLADGWRARVSGTYQFARRGDRITAPADIIRSAAKHGILIIEE